MDEVLEFSDLPQFRYIPLFSSSWPGRSPARRAFWRGRVEKGDLIEASYSII